MSALIVTTGIGWTAGAQAQKSRQVEPTPSPAVSLSPAPITTITTPTLKPATTVFSSITQPSPESEHEQEPHGGPFILTGSIQIMSRTMVDGIEHTVGIQGSTKSNLTSGHITLGLFQGDKKPSYTGLITSATYYSRSAVDISGFVMKDGVSIPVTLVIRADNQGKNKMLSCLSEYPEFTLPMQKISSGTFRISYQE